MQEIIITGELIGIGRLDADDPYSVRSFGDAVVRTDSGDVRVVGLSQAQCRTIAPLMYQRVAITINLAVPS